MAGLKLQYLTNPAGSTPSFIFGNPQRVSKKTVAKKRKARENKKIRNSKMAKKKAKKRGSARKSHRKSRRRNPEISTGIRHGRAKVIGHSATRAERFAHIKSLLAERKRVQSENVPYTPGMTGEEKAALRKAARKSLRKGQRSARKFQKGWHKRVKALAKAHKEGYVSSTSDIDEKRLGRITRGHSKAKRKAAKRAKSLKRSKKRKASSRKKKAAATRKKNRGTQLIRVPKKRKQKKAKKARKPSKKARKAKARKPSKKARKTKARKVKAARKAKAAKKASARRKAKALRKIKKKMHPYQKNPRRRRGSHRSGRKSRKHGLLRNPSEGIKQMGDKLMALLNKLTGGEASNVPYLAAAAVGNDVVGSAFNMALRKYAPTLRAKMAAINPNLPTYVLPIVPGLAFAFACSKASDARVKKLGQAAGLVTLVDLIQSLTAMVSGPALKAAGLSGVDFTRSLRGVDFTMGAVPRGLSAIPRGMRGVQFTPGMKGLTSRDRSDFGSGDWIRSPGGTLKTNADFGRQMADFGAVPTLRGAHTGDQQYQDSGDDDSESSTDESSDHTV